MHEYSRVVPADYDPNKKHPLILHLHGFGARPQSEVAPLLSDYADYMVSYSPDGSVALLPSIAGLTDSILVAATYHAPDEGDIYTYGKEAEQFHLDLLNLMKKQYNIDEDRIWMFGDSMGGFGMLNFASHRPDMYAGIAGGGVTLSPLPPISQAYEWAMGGKFLEIPWVWEESCPVGMADNLLNVYIVYGHGQKDTVVPLEHGRALRDKLIQLGYEHTYLEFPEAGHSWRCWAPTCFKAQEFILKGVKRNPSPQKVVYKTNDLYWNKAYWVRINALGVQQDEEFEKPLEEIYEEVDDLGLRGYARDKKIEEAIRRYTKFGKVIAEKFLAGNRLQISMKHISRLSLDLALAGLKGTDSLKINLENQSSEPITIVLIGDWEKWGDTSSIVTEGQKLVKAKDYKILPTELSILNLLQGRHNFTIIQ